MFDLIGIAADYILSILTRKTNMELTHGRRKTAYVLMTVFLVIVFGMAAYAVYGMAQMILKR